MTMFWIMVVAAILNLILSIFLMIKNKSMTISNLLLAIAINMVIVASGLVCWIFSLEQQWLSML